jgi:hypothetical protein
VDGDRTAREVPLRPLAAGAAVALAAVCALAAFVGVMSSRGSVDTAAAGQPPTTVAAGVPPLDRIAVLVTSCAGAERAAGVTTSGADDKGRWLIQDGLGARALVDLTAGTVAVVPATTAPSVPAAFVTDAKGHKGRGERKAPAPAKAPAAPATTQPPAPPTTPAPAPADPYAACAPH